MKLVSKIKNTIVVILNSKTYGIVILGLVALLSALVSWMGSMYEDLKSDLLLEYNNLTSQSYNEHLGGSLYYYQDLELQKNIDNLLISFGVAELAGDEEKVLETSYQLVRSMSSFNGEDYAKQVMLWDTEDYLDNTDVDENETMYEYINNWMAKYSERKAASAGTKRQDTVISQYIDVDSTYFSEANKLRDEATEKYNLAQIYSGYCDRYNVVIMLYSLVLFLMGIVTNVEEGKGVKFITLISTVIVIFASYYALTVPLPFFL